MTINQEKHLTRIKQQFVMGVEDKYKKGVEEHGGNLWEMNIFDLLDNAISETIDQYTYLVTLRNKLFQERSAKVDPNKT